MRAKTIVIGVTLWIACFSTALAQQAPRAPEVGDLTWISGSDGGIPIGATPLGHEADGRQQFVCRGAIEGGTHLGKIAPGFAGCNIGYGGRELTIPRYEVLTRGSRSAEGATSAAAARRGARAAARRQDRQFAATDRVDSSMIAVDDTVGATSPGAAERAGGAPKRGFDEEGRPYVEVRMPDGTIKRIQSHGITLIKPDGTSQFIRTQRITINAPAPTPPELPSDPNRGRAWIERHNDELLQVIRALVNRDAAEMKKFADAEGRASSDDVFGQIAYRTEVANFLAQDR